MATKTTTKKTAPKVSVSMLKTGTSTAGTSKALAPTKTAATVSSTGKVTPGMFNEAQPRSPFSAQETAVSQMMNQNVTGKLPATPMPLVSNIGKQVQAVSNVSKGGGFNGSSNTSNYVSPVNSNTYNAPAPVAPTTAPSAGMFDNAPGARSESTPQDVQDKETTLADVARQMQKLIMSDESVKDPSIDNAMAEEELARKRLQDYQNSMLMGQQKLGEQVIPMEFITGQQRSLEARGALGEMPLQQGLENARLARSAAQAQRQAAFDTKKDKIAGLSTIANLLSSQQKTGGPITLGKDQVAIDPATGKVLYSNKSEEPAFGATADGQKFNAEQQKKFDSINTVSGQLKNYRDLIDQYTGFGGYQISGTQAAELRTAKSNLEFAIADAVGTGALQAADRAVVQDMIPDPTSLGGAAGSALRGGKQGNLAALDQAQKIFDAKRNTLTSQQPQVPGQVSSGGSLTWDSI